MCEPMPTTYRMERMERQTKALREYAARLERRSPSFPFNRLTSGQSHANVDATLQFGASAIQPYIGVFAGKRISQTFVTAYPGVVMTLAEYNNMPFVVPTATDTPLKHKMTANDQSRYGSIVIVGLPIAPGVNVMSTESTRRQPNVFLYLSTRQLVVTATGKLTVPSDFISVNRITLKDNGDQVNPIPKNKELFVEPYNENFLSDMPSHCDYCFAKDSKENMYMCSASGCQLRFHARCQVGTAERNFMCPDHKVVMQAEADESEGDSNDDDDSLGTVSSLSSIQSSSSDDEHKERSRRSIAMSRSSTASAAASIASNAVLRDAQASIDASQRHRRRVLERPASTAKLTHATNIATTVHNWHVVNRKRRAPIGGAIVIWVYISSDSWIRAFGGNTPLSTVIELFEEVRQSGDAPSMSLVHLSPSETGYMAAFSTMPTEQVTSVPAEPARGASNKYNLITWEP